MFRLYVVLCIIILFAACNSQKKAVFKQNQSNIYQPSRQSIRPEFAVFHSSDTISQLLVKLNLDELLFNQANPENTLQAMLRFRYSLVDITTDAFNKAISDSITITKKFEKPQGRDVIVVSLNLRAKPKKTYVLNIEVFDMLRNAGQKNFVIVDKSGLHTPQNFRVIAIKNNMPLFSNYVPEGDSVKIILNRKADKLYIKYARNNTPLPPPPFSSQTEPTFTFNSDSSWSVPYSVEQLYQIPKRGFYLIQTDTTQPAGLFLCGVNRSYPMVTTTSSMISPLEYLSTSEEFKAIKSADNPKIAVDNFWLKLSGNVAVGREMIRVYYNRMYYANMYFHSYKEGWKTDRGMIYMVFGPPSYIRKTATTEIWEYYIKEDASNLTINFIKANSLYSHNHYIMQRSDMFTPFWRVAIETWRSGKVFTLEE
jgi:GWxTD domain-containing protein